jgi:2-C-methyl-D-erythritol 4-phosphate cytidylyltransferase
MVEQESLRQVGAIILATGEAGDDLLWADLQGVPVVAHAVCAFTASPLVAEIALMVSAQHLVDAQALVAQERWENVLVVAGESHMRSAIMTGLATLSPACTTIIIHDGTRPLVTEAIIAEGLHAVGETGAATAGLPVKDTIKRVNDAGMVLETPARATLYTLQTPQIFARDVLLSACQAIDPMHDITDAAQLVDLAGGRVVIFPGAPTNLRISTPDDLALLHALSPIQP